MFVALTEDARNRPSSCNCLQDWHLVSCLHAIGCAFVLQKTPDTDLNEAIAVIDSRRENLALETAARLLDALTNLDWKLFMEEVAEMHGRISRDWYRETAEHVISALKETIEAERDLTIRYLAAVR